MPTAHTFAEQSECARNALKIHVRNMGVAKIEYMKPSYTARYASEPINGGNRDVLIENWYFPWIRKKSAVEKVARSAGSAATAATLGVAAAADTTLSPFPPGFAPTPGMAQSLVDDIYATGPGGVSKHLVDDHTWTGMLVTVLDGMDTLMANAEEREDKRTAKRMLREIIRRATWNLSIVRFRSLIWRNRNSRPLKAYHIREVQVARIDPSEREHFEQIPLIDLERNTREISRYKWDFRADRNLMGLLGVGTAVWYPPQIDAVGDSIEIYDPNDPRSTGQSWA